MAEYLVSEESRSLHTNIALACISALASLENENGSIGVFSKAGCEHKACEASAGNDVIVRLQDFIVTDEPEFSL
jgi:hypothetical protein